MIERRELQVEELHVEVFRSLKIAHVNDVMLQLGRGDLGPSTWTFMAGLPGYAAVAEIVDSTAAARAALAKGSRLCKSAREATLSAMNRSGRTSTLPSR